PPAPSVLELLARWPTLLHGESAITVLADLQQTLLQHVLGGPGMRLQPLLQVLRHRDRCETLLGADHVPALNHVVGTQIGQCLVHIIGGPHKDVEQLVRDLRLHDAPVGAALRWSSTTCGWPPPRTAAELAHS